MSKKQVLYSTPNGLVRDSIKPSAGSKFSPNLHRYLGLKRNARTLTHGYVFKDNSGILWLGWLDDCGAFIGLKLMQALSERDAIPACHLRAPGGVAWEGLVIRDFWDQYLRHGRCATDREHDIGFMGDETRWTVSGSSRTCNWCQSCSQHLVKQGKVVLSEVWETVDPSAKSPELDVPIRHRIAEVRNGAAQATLPEKEALLQHMQSQARSLQEQMDWLQQEIRTTAAASK